MEVLYENRQAALERYRLQYIAAYGNSATELSEGECEDEID